MLNIKEAKPGDRVEYEPSPGSPNKLIGTFQRPAKGKQPAAMVLFDGEPEPRIAYACRLSPIGLG